MGYRDYSPSYGFLVDVNGHGDFTTIAAALTAATSGKTIFILPGTYTEDLTLKVGVNLTAFGSDSSQNGTGKVIISGNATLSTAGTVTISGIQLQTNSGSFLTVSGSVASVVNLENCYLNASAHDGITYSSSSASSKINIRNCAGNVGTTGIKVFAHSSAGTLSFYDSDISNSGASTTASTVSAGTVSIYRCTLAQPITTSGTGTFNGTFMALDSSAQNATCLTLGGSGGGTFIWCQFNAGTASAITTSQVLNIYKSAISSSNTNAITGAGTINYGSLTFTGSSGQTINTTTQTHAGTLQGSTTTAPTAGYLGEQLTANASTVATTNSTAKTITSVNLTAGVWDVSGSAFATPTGGTGLMQIMQCGISSTNNTFAGTLGIDYIQTNVTAGTGNMGLIAPLTRVVVSTTTTYYLIVANFYTSTTCPTNAKITGTRVG